MKVPSPEEYELAVQALMVPATTPDDWLGQHKLKPVVMKHAFRGIQALRLLFACRDALELPIGQDARREVLRLIDEVTDGYEV